MKASRYVPQEDLKDKYKLPRIDRIRTFCKSIKSIGLATNLQTAVEQKPNDTIHVTVTADPQSSKKEFDTAIDYIIGEFIKEECQHKYLDGRKGIGADKANKIIGEDKQRSIQNGGERCLPLTKGALKRHDLLVCSELRQFRCPKCLSPFWRTVLTHKPVASCKKCKLCLCPLKREEEFGIGRFVCSNPTCSNVFYSRCQATDVRQCKYCRDEVKNPYIHPKFRPPKGRFPPGIRKPPVHRYSQVSQVHECTGSTISLFLTQYDEATDTESVDLDDYDEGDCDEGDSDDDD